jgi:UDP-2,3-diacylglucosamine pyrophosphatase LpxH
MRRHFRTLFISDVHLGTRECQADRLLSFLDAHEANQIYLVGDIVDGWALRKSWYWPKSHQTILRRLLLMAQNGIRVVYVVGNHDEFLRDFEGIHLGKIEVVERVVHRTVGGGRYLVVHGDLFDMVLRHAPWLARTGRCSFLAASIVSHALDAIRHVFRLVPWSFNCWAREKVDHAVSLISGFERALSKEAQGLGFDGVICGHIHRPAISDEHGVRYVNCGDWIKHCTAAVEREDGTIEIIVWPKN